MFNMTFFRKKDISYVTTKQIFKEFKEKLSFTVEYRLFALIGTEGDANNRFVRTIKQPLKSLKLN